MLEPWLFKNKSVVIYEVQEKAPSCTKPSWPWRGCRAGLTELCTARGAKAQVLVLQPLLPFSVSDAAVTDIFCSFHVYAHTQRCDVQSALTYAQRAALTALRRQAVVPDPCQKRRCSKWKRGRQNPPRFGLSWRGCRRRGTAAAASPREGVHSLFGSRKERMGFRESVQKHLGVADISQRPHPRPRASAGACSGEQAGWAEGLSPVLRQLCCALSPPAARPGHPGTGQAHTAVLPAGPQQRRARAALYRA